MKKSLLTLSLVALFSVAVNAQDHNKKAQPKKTEASTTVSSGASVTTTVNADGTTVESTAPAENKNGEAAPKKGGTRMAINEKGMPGNSKSTSTTKKESTTKKD